MTDSPPPAASKDAPAAGGASRAATRSTRDFRRRRRPRAFAERALDLPDLPASTPVGGYWPIRSEVDPRPLMEALLERGQDVALSQILHPHLSWRLWQPGDPLIKGGFGVREPGPDAPEVLPARRCSCRSPPSTAAAAASATARAISTGPSRRCRDAASGPDGRARLCGSGDRRRCRSSPMTGCSTSS